MIINRLKIKHMETKVRNWDVIANYLFDGVGYLKELGDYSSRYQQEAYEALGIDGELGEDEWCDLMETDKGYVYAVYGDTSGDMRGVFYFKRVVAIKWKDLRDIDIPGMAEEMYDNKHKKIYLLVNEDGETRVEIDPSETAIKKSVFYIHDINRGCDYEETREETIDKWAEFLLEEFEEKRKESRIEIIYI